MVTQLISANFRTLYSCTAYNKTLNDSTKSQPYLQFPSASNKTRALQFNTGGVRERIYTQAISLRQNKGH